MKKRPNQHQLEDLSRAKFQLCLPKNWVFRDKDKDYGIDGEIELFDKEGNSQGLMFYVQLKATGLKTKSSVLNVDFKIDTLNYYKQLEIPVLLARHSEKEDKFYLRWMNDIDLTFSKEGAKTFRIKLLESVIWDDNTSAKIEKTLLNVRLLKSGHFDFPISYSIILNEDEIQGLSNRLFKIELRNKLKELTNFLKFKKSNENPLFKVNINSNTLIVQPGILASTYFHGINRIKKDSFFNELSSAILLALATSMVSLGQVDKGGRIIFENQLEKILLEKEEIFMLLLPYLLKSSFFESTLNMINEGIDIEDKSFLRMPSVMILLLRLDVQGKRKKEIIESFFKTRLEKTKLTGINPLIATAYYNLGNYYKNNGRYSESISCYVNAKKNDKNYLKRSYFYKELGGYSSKSTGIKPHISSMKKHLI